MKTWKKYFLQSCLVLFITGTLTSCGSFANMSEQDAYDVGRGLGLTARYLIDN